jgi:hypothetical protein
VFDIGDRVYYRDNGPEDVGTVVKVDDEGVWVEFDRDKAFSYPETDAYEPEQLAPAQ